MLTKMQAALQEYDMLRGCRHVMVALSGGADSVSLLCALTQLQASLDIRVSAIHVNHHLRGAESDRDAAFCVALCQKLGVPIQVVDCDVKGYQATHRCSTEEAARAVRYAAFETVTDSPDIRLATAHTASDNTETILFHLARGTGLKGLTGIPPVRGALIRPLLYVTREEILAYLAAIPQEYVTDSSNQSDAYMRNRIRHHVIPELMRQNPALHRTVHGMVKGLEQDQQFLEAQTDAAYQYCLLSPDTLCGLRALHPALQNRCIARFLTDHSITCSYSLVCRVQALLEKDGVQNIAKGVYLTANAGTLSLQYGLQKPAISLQECALQPGENHWMDGKTLHATYVSAKKLTNHDNIHNLFANSQMDCGKIIGTVVLRARRPGDRIALPGRGFTASVKKLLQAKIPPEERPHLHYLADDAGLIWIEQIGVAQRVTPDAQTKTLLILSVDTDSAENQTKKE